MKYDILTQNSGRSIDLRSNVQTRKLFAMRRRVCVPKAMAVVQSGHELKLNKVLHSIDPNSATVWPNALAFGSLTPDIALYYTARFHKKRHHRRDFTAM